MVPYDWTIYYLRKKALSRKIEKEELAWIILNFNQKRGYYQLRGEEEEENLNKKTEFYSLKITDVVADESPNSKGETWYSLILENGWIYRRSSKVSLEDWKDKTRDFIVTTDLNEDGSVKKDKEGAEKRSFRAPKEDDWGLVKKKTEQEIEQTKKTVGQYIYDSLLNKPNQKIKGKLVRTIERKFYRHEIEAILKKQIELQPEFFSNDLYNLCVRELYRKNEAHQITLSKKDFVHLLVNDIIFYQRPLRSQKSTISNCSLEYRTYKVNEELKKEYLKAIPKSNTYYQEFRIWQWLYNLKLYTTKEDINVTSEFVKNTEDLENLFDFLMTQKEVTHKDILKFFMKDLKGKALNDKISHYRWNYVYDEETKESKPYPMNETRFEITKRMNKVVGIKNDFLTLDVERKLWHILYSVTDKKEYEQALKSFAAKNNLNIDSFVEHFSKFPPFKSEHGAFSEKAIKKLLPLLRIGKYWKWDNIDTKTKDRIINIINAEQDDIKLIVREKAEKHQLQSEADFQGLPLWLTQYIVYDRHSEAENAGKWNTLNDLENFLKDFKQHSLRNPIVEQVVTETLRVVKDIWQYYGNGVKDYFNAIHVELGRDMKNTTEERKRLTKVVTNNENTNTRIKALLIELMNDQSVENVRPYSPTQQEILRIYEEGVLNSNIVIEDEILNISKKSEPTKAELQRYKLWLEQKYHSPYTGKIIPLNKLFTSDFEIEHIIPQSRYFDDSLSNKVICEAAVNKLKDNQLGMEFIANHHGQKVQVGYGKEVTIFNEQQYKDFVNEHYAKNKAKKIKLLLNEIPDQMIERQMNDSRYISKYVSQVLSNIVRSDKDDEGINSKNIVPGGGRITNILKQDWGLNDVWNDLILPRFERMNKLTNSNSFTTYNDKYQKFLPTVPFEYSKGFQKKRIDHRHHALDALIIACATRDHVNLLNNQSAKSDTKRIDLQHKLRLTQKWVDKNGKERNKFTEFIKPWPTFTQDAKESLEKIVISFKQNLRVINKATNKYQKWEEKNGILKKVLVEQKGINWAIRKPMHEETVSGKVDLPWVKLGKGEITTATRERNDLVLIFKDVKTIDKAEAKISKITDTGIQKILINYLRSKDNKPELAFSPEGIEEMNKNITQFNDGIFHHPILKVRTYEKGKGRFILGSKGNKKNKFVQGAPNLYYAIYWDNKINKRTFETIPLNIVIERQKQGLTPVPEINENNENLLFYLSPDDLIYVPTEDEKANINSINIKNLNNNQIKRIFFVNDFSGATCYFRPNRFAKAIATKEVDLGFNEKKNKLSGSFDSKTASLDVCLIKDCCIKIVIDRIGNISNA